MTSTYKLKAEKRSVSGSGNQKLRKSGMIPAVVYGKGKENENLQVEEISFAKVFSKTGENVLVELEIEGGSPRNVLAHEVQLDPISGKVIHVDFYEVRMDEKIETEVPLEFVGEAPAVKDLEGTLIANKTEVTVKCLPANIPHNIEVDISKLITLDDSITAADLKIPSNVELITDPEETIALVNPPRSEEELKELESAVEENVEAVEATAEKKEDEGEEAKAESEPKAEEKKE